jgi:hypothetical protein
MKVAVLLTGQLRTFKMVKYLHLNSLILKYNADVFLGIDLNNKYQCEYKNSKNLTTSQEINEVNDFFKPVNTFVLDNFDFFKGNSIHLIFRQYYIVKNTYKMLKTHSDNNKIKYDLIIRLRFDQMIFSDEVPIAPGLWDSRLNCVLYNETNINILKKYSLNKKFIFKEINDNTIYVFGFGDFKHYKYANDQFFYHNHSLLDQMFNFYDNILKIMKYCSENKIGNEGALIECIFYLYITQFNNITLKKSNISGFFIREFN